MIVDDLRLDLPVLFLVAPLRILYETQNCRFGNLHGRLSPQGPPDFGWLQCMALRIWMIRMQAHS